MRSLTPTGHLVLCPDDGLNADQVSAKVSKLAVNPESGAIYVAIEKSATDGSGLDLEVTGWEFDKLDGWKAKVRSTPASCVLAPFPIPSNGGETVDLHYFPDDETLVVLLAGGDIVIIYLARTIDGSAPSEVIGTIDSGIKGAAWSPDDEHLILITGEDNLVCMTRNFDTLHEEPLRTEDFGEDKFINVGWGSKATQFHGSLGKAAAKAEPIASTSAIPSSLSHSTDDGLPVITFRGDASYFAVSSLDPYPQSPTYSRRQVRIYSREASAGFVPKLSATSESLPGLEGPLTWRPSGNVISGLVRYGYEGGAPGQEGRWEVAMLERNGLRHGGFPLREDKAVWGNGKIKGMSWNADSEVLAICVERGVYDVIQLWTMKNYHYYLKQELFTVSTTNRRITSFKWHPEKPLTLYLVEEGHVQVRSFVWDTYASQLAMPNDTASVAVVDGSRLLVTPFRTQNTPPPMSSYSITLPATPVHVACSPTSDALAVLFQNGLVQLWDLNTRLPDKKGSKLRGGGRVAEPQLRWEKTLERSEANPKSLTIDSAGEIWVLCTVTKEATHSEALAVQLEGTHQSSLSCNTERILASGSQVWALEADGTFQTIIDGDPVELCANTQSIAIAHEAQLIFALSESGKLYFAPLSLVDAVDPSLLASSVTSFTLTSDFLIYTTSAQNSYYAPIPLLRRVAEGEDVTPSEQNWETRRVERGALAVVACPSSMSLVLQMPRGNLETVYPRALVLAVVRKDVLAGDYRSAFVQCRKHRLDLNILYDLAPKQFMDSLPEFVRQIPEVDYLNLFVSALNDDDCTYELFKDIRPDHSASKPPSTKVNSICDSLRAQLEAQDITKYVETILTAHVCKRPPDYESALRVLLQLQAEHEAIVEDAIKYIIFLSDVNQLFDVALGMYNFQLVLMVAQYSQKDPKEYLPFLRELRALDQHEQRFRIDDHLGRRASALRNLANAGLERFEDAASYLSRYELYDEAFRIYKDDQEHLPVVHDLYGDYLYDRREFYDAAISFGLAGKPDKAMKSYEKAHAWRELFTLAMVQSVDQDAKAAMVERVTDHLTSRGKSFEAAQIHLDYAQDVDSAVSALSHGAEFAEASRIASLHNRPDLVESVIHPGLDDAHESLTEVFEEMSGQLDKEMARLGELRRIRLEDPDSFYIVDTEPALEGVDVATQATTVATAFTRYTVAPTTAFSQSTKITGQTNKSKHKASRKRAAGRKGTVDEYEYLVASLGRLVIRADEKSAEAVPLLRQLILASSSHRELAKSLQETVISFRTNLAESLEEAWRGREEILAGVKESGGMGLGGDASASAELVRPEVAGWKGLGVLAG